MMNSKHFLLHISLLILFLFFSFSSAHNKSHATPSSSSNSSYQGCFSKVYAFGDSYTDTGNAFLLDGFTSFIGGLLTNTLYGSTTKLPGERLCNGRLVIDFLCENLGLRPLAAYKNTTGDFSCGCNFAVAGATALSSDNFTNHMIKSPLPWKAIPESLLIQMDWFNKFLSNKACVGKSDSECKSELEDALFWIGEMGINDYARVWGSSISTQWLTEMVVGKICKILKTVLDRGAKYIVVQGLPPVGCSPLDLTVCPTKDRDQLGCSSTVNTMIIAHNNLLQKRLAEFRKKYANCHIIFADIWTAYKTILLNYKKYKFVEPFKACCGTGGGLLNFKLHKLCGSTGTSACKNPQHYINWDGMHLTEAMHYHLADLLFNQGHCHPSFHGMIQVKIKAKIEVKAQIAV